MIEKKTGAAITEMFNNDPDNTWVFTGGEAVQGGFAQVGGARNYVGHFEEYIRWKKGSETEEMRQRYTINTAKKGQTLKEIVENWDSRVKIFDPKAVVYLVGAEEYEKGIDGIADFQIQLEKFLEKALALRKNTGFAVIQKHYATADAEENAKIESYNSAVDAVLALYKKDREKSERIVSVEHYAQTEDCTDFREKKLNADGSLNLWGHLEIGKQLCEATIQTAEGYPADLAGLDEIPISLQEAKGLPAEIANVGKIISHSPKVLQQKIAEKKSLTWLFMGDSITHAAAWTNGYDGIAQLFEKYLKDELGRTDDVVVNTAVSGATTTTTLPYLQQRLEKYSPDVVSIMLGTNDCAAEDQTTEQYEADLRQIIGKAKAKGAVVILRTPTPGMRDELLVPYLEKLKKLAAEDESLIYIDHHTHMKEIYTKYPQLFSRFYLDHETMGLHPGSNGHLVMTREFIMGCGLWKNNSRILNLFYEI